MDGGGEEGRLGSFLWPGKQERWEEGETGAGPDCQVEGTVAEGDLWFW